MLGAKHIQDMKCKLETQNTIMILGICVHTMYVGHISWLTIVYVTSLLCTYDWIGLQYYNMIYGMHKNIKIWVNSQGDVYTCLYSTQVITEYKINRWSMHLNIKIFHFGFLF